jgi:hypothetical protein
MFFVDAVRVAFSIFVLVALLNLGWRITHYVVVGMTVFQEF